MTAQADPTDYRSAPDDDLVQRARAGDRDALGILWRRHAGAAYSVARTFRTLDADDLVSEAFMRVMESLDAGKGPHTAFRPYLTMVVRNVGRYHFGRLPAIVEREKAAQGEDFTTASAEDLNIEAFDQSAAAAAFLSLPERWQQALWYTEIDGLKPKAVSELIGIPANAVSALARRAKRAFRDAWVTQQLGTATSAECSWAIGQMGTHARNGLSERSRLRLETHLRTCPTCPAAMREATRLSRLLLVLLPPLLGVAGAAAYSAAAPAPAMADALLASERDSPASAAPSGEQSQRRRTIIAGWVIASAIVLAGVIVVLISALGGRFEGDRLATPASDQVMPSQPSASDAPPTAMPTAPPPTPSPPATEDGPEREDAPPAAPPGASPALPPTSPGSPANPPGQTRPLSAPRATLLQTDTRLFPRVSGMDAIPGAEIELVAENGAVVGSTTARRDGSWETRVTAGDSGSHTVTARQVVGGVSSPPSSALSYIVTAPPVIASPTAGQTVDGSRFLFSYTASAGSYVQREIVGVTTLQTLRTPANGLWREYYSASPGPHTVTIRYVDPSTGDYGPSRVSSFIASG